jgi:anti-sigma factor RsiW
MTCEHWREQLDAYVDDSCTPEQLGGLEEHLRTCSLCAAEAIARLQLKRATRAAASARYVPSPEFRLRIEKTVRKSRRPAWKSAWRSAWIPAIGGAVLLALIVISTGLFMRHTAREQVVAELLDMHVATLASANPVDVVSTDRHTVKPWFQGKLPFTFNLPELQDSPFKLDGGKLIYFKHNPGAQLLFEVRKHQISVFIVQNQAGLDSLPAAVTASREKGFSVEMWSQGGLRYAVISDTNAADVHALADLLRAAGHP